MTAAELSIGLVEDSDLDYEMAINSMRQMSVPPRVFRASTIQEAEELLTGRTLDLLIVDVNLPDGSGIQFVSRLQANKLNAAQRIVMFSTSTNPIDKEMATDAGADAYYEKPFETEQYMEAVRQIVNSVVVGKTDPTR